MKTYLQHNESASPAVKVGDRVRVLPNYREANDDHGYRTIESLLTPVGNIGTVVDVALEDLYILVMDNPDTGFRDYFRIFGMNPSARDIIKYYRETMKGTLDDPGVIWTVREALEIIPPDASVMYKGRRHRPLKESAEDVLSPGTRVRILPNLIESLEDRDHPGGHSWAGVGFTDAIGVEMTVLSYGGGKLYMLSTADSLLGHPLHGIGHNEEVRRNYEDIFGRPGPENVVWAYRDAIDPTPLDPAVMYKSRRHRS